MRRASVAPDIGGAENQLNVGTDEVWLGLDVGYGFHEVACELPAAQQKSLQYHLGRCASGRPISPEASSQFMNVLPCSRSAAELRERDALMRFAQFVAALLRGPASCCRYGCFARVRAA